jgi:hemerythrin
MTELTRIVLRLNTVLKFSVDKYQMELSGINIIDVQHSKLIGMLNEANAQLAIHTGEDDEVVKWKALLTLIGQLDDYAEKHFATEEEWMAQVGYPDLEGQQMSHRLFKAKVRQQMATLADLDEKKLQSIIDYVENWLYSHINVETVLFRKYANTKAG